MNYNISKNVNLRDYGFKFDGFEYKKMICVYYQKNRNGIKIPHIFMNVVINKEENHFGYNIVLRDGITLYYPYYQNDYGKSSVVDLINVNIERETRRLINYGILMPGKTQVKDDKSL